MKKPKQFDSQNYTMGNGFMSRPSSADSDWGRVEESRDEEEFQPIRSLDYLVTVSNRTHQRQTILLELFVFAKGQLSVLRLYCDWFVPRLSLLSGLV